MESRKTKRNSREAKVHSTNRIQIGIVQRAAASDAKKKYRLPKKTSEELNLFGGFQNHGQVLFTHHFLQLTL